jgi:hypothetical protein
VSTLSRALPPTAPQPFHTHAHARAHTHKHTHTHTHTHLHTHTLALTHTHGTHTRHTHTAHTHTAHTHTPRARWTGGGWPLTRRRWWVPSATQQSWRGTSGRHTAGRSQAHPWAPVRVCACVCVCARARVFCLRCRVGGAARGVGGARARARGHRWRSLLTRTLCDAHRAARVSCVFMRVCVCHAPRATRRRPR